MKFFIVLALAMLISFSMESKLRCRSKAKALKAWYLNRPVYAKSAHNQYLAVTNKYKLSVSNTKDTSWTITPIGNDKYYVIANKGDYLCLSGLFKIPSVCRNGGGDSEWRLTTSGTFDVGFKGNNGNYLRAGLLSLLTTTRRMQDWEHWTLSKA